MKTFNISKINKLGEFHDTYGQSYWAEVHEQLMPVKFNSQLQDIGVGARISCEEWVNKQSVKGTEYQQLKRVKLVEGSGGVESSIEPQHTAQPQQPATGASNEVWERIAVALEVIAENTKPQQVSASVEDVDSLFGSEEM